MLGVMCISVAGCSDEVSNKTALKDKSNRYITVINNTDQVIDHLYIYTGKGIEVENRKNLDNKDISYKIDDAYKKYNKFTVVLVDRYERDYKKTATIKSKGTTEVEVKKSDMISKDAFKNFSALLNGD